MSSQFKRVCFANFFVFISVYMLFPSLPVVMAGRLDMTITEAGYIFLFMISGRLAAGPFINYLLDVFKRKYLCITALAIMLVATVSYLIVDTYNNAYILSFILGVAIGVASASLITLGIDITVSEERSKGNVILGRSTRSAMIAGVALGSFVYLNGDFIKTILLSVITGSIGVVLLLSVHVPFRAPMGTKLLSLDRFMLPRTLPLAVNMIMIAMVPGILMPLIHFEINTLFVINRYIVSYPIVAAVGFLLALFVMKSGTRVNEKNQLLTGLTLLVLALSFFMLFNAATGKIVSALLFGISLALITPAFLMMFIDLSSHCERASANTTNLFSWGIGVSVGVTLSCYLKDNYSSLTAYQSAMFSATAALIWFILVSYPYYRKKKVR